ncbi:hypothetical protein SUGI_0969580 [Cryptomeria japonica]|nr:hypothetical protein SUGI_0969580 [Cryptomeria japonica]
MVLAPASAVRAASLAATHSLLGAAFVVGSKGSTRPSLDVPVSSSTAAVAARVPGLGDAAAASRGLFAGFKQVLKRQSGDRGELVIVLRRTELGFKFFHRDQFYCCVFSRSKGISTIKVTQVGFVGWGSGYSALSIVFDSLSNLTLNVS